VRKRIAIGAGAIAAAIGTWTVLASRLFVWMGGLSAYFPSPWVTWWRYARQPVIDGSTLLYLIASGIIAAVPIVLISALIGLIIQRMMRRSASLYGKTGWSTKAQMKTGGLQLRDQL
jgi:hypothetical protein